MNTKSDHLGLLRLGYLAVAVLLLLCLGLIYAWSVFRTPLEQEFGWNKAQTSGIFSISMMTFCLGGLTSGIISGKKGTRFTLVCCALCLAAGFIGAARVTTLYGIYISYGGLCGFGVGLGYNAVLGLIIRWFPDNQGFVSGISMMGFGLGGMVLGILGARMITLLGWRTTFWLLGVIFSLLMLAGGTILRAPPKACSREMRAPAYAVEELTWQEMLHRRNFWIFAAWAVVMTAAGLAIINEATTYAADFVGGDLVRAAALGGLISVANGVGRVLFGRAFDVMGYRVTMFSLSVLYMLSSVLLLLSAATGALPILAAGFLTVGLAYGGVPPTNSANTARFFGQEHYGLNFSLLNLNMIAASYLGPICGRTYSGISIAIVVFAGIGALFTALLQRPQENSKRR